MCAGSQTRIDFMTDAQTRGRRTLILISLLFAVPIALAMYLYFSGSTWVPASTTAHGVLINPPRQLSDTQLSPGDEEARFRKTWALVVLAEDSCARACNDALTNIRQVRLSLGPKMTRMQTIFLPGNDAAIETSLQTGHPKLVIVSPQTAKEFRNVIGPYEDGEIFLVDPLGNLMMRYPPGTGMGDIREDIAHLFKLSGIG
jgi:hypothetical protein